MANEKQNLVKKKKKTYKIQKLLNQGEHHKEMFALGHKFQLKFTDQCQGMQSPKHGAYTPCPSSAQLQMVLRSDGCHEHLAASAGGVLYTREQYKAKREVRDICEVIRYVLAQNIIERERGGERVKDRP